MVGGRWLDQAPTSIERIVSINFWFCWVAVFISEARVAQAFAPFLPRLPPVIFRITTAGRSARSAALLVASRSLSHRNAVSSP
jgi:hypothetical protein